MQEQQHHHSHHFFTMSPDSKIQDFLSSGDNIDNLIKNNNLLKIYHTWISEVEQKTEQDQTYTPIQKTLTGLYHLQQQLQQTPHFCDMTALASLITTIFPAKAASSITTEKPELTQLLKRLYQQLNVAKSLTPPILHIDKAQQAIKTAGQYLSIPLTPADLKAPTSLGSPAPLTVPRRLEPAMQALDEKVNADMQFPKLDAWAQSYATPVTRLKALTQLWHAIDEQGFSTQYTIQQQRSALRYSCFLVNSLMHTGNIPWSLLTDWNYTLFQRLAALQSSGVFAPTIPSEATSLPLAVFLANLCQQDTSAIDHITILSGTELIQCIDLALTTRLLPIDQLPEIIHSLGQLVDKGYSTPIRIPQKWLTQLGEKYTWNDPDQAVSCLQGLALLTKHSTLTYRISPPLLNAILPIAMEQTDPSTWLSPLSQLMDVWAVDDNQNFDVKPLIACSGKLRSPPLSTDQLKESLVQLTAICAYLSPSPKLPVAALTQAMKELLNPTSRLPRVRASRTSSTRPTHLTWTTGKLCLNLNDIIKYSPELYNPGEIKELCAALVPLFDTLVVEPTSLLSVTNALYGAASLGAPLTSTITRLLDRLVTYFRQADYQNNIPQLSRFIYAWFMYKPSTEKLPTSIIACRDAHKPKPNPLQKEVLRLLKEQREQKIEATIEEPIGPFFADICVTIYRKNAVGQMVAYKIVIELNGLIHNNFFQAIDDSARKKILIEKGGVNDVIDIDTMKNMTAHDIVKRILAYSPPLAPSTTKPKEEKAKKIARSPQTTQVETTPPRSISEEKLSDLTTACSDINSPLDHKEKEEKLPDLIVTTPSDTNTLSDNKEKMSSAKIKSKKTSKTGAARRRKQNKKEEKGSQTAHTNRASKLITQITPCPLKKTNVEVLIGNARAGDSIAQHMLSICYLFGLLGLHENPQAAFYWCLQSAEADNPAAQFDLGSYYYQGVGITNDPEAAVNWYRKAAKHGSAEAQSNLGHFYQNGEGVTKDEKIAVTWYRKAAMQGLPAAQSNLGLCYQKGDGVTKDEKTAVTWYRKAAMQGFAGAQLNLGHCYENGIGVATNVKAAIEWYQKAAEQGLPEAQFNLGLCYRDGKGFTPDEKTAAEWFLKAAQQGLPQAQFELSICYQGGRGVPEDATIAVEWLLKAAQQGLVKAQIALSICYFNGLGVKKNESIGASWLLKAARQGSAKAQLELGHCYQNGDGVIKDEKIGVEWILKAAQQHYPEAQCYLGEYYQNQGDHLQAKEWYQKAASKGLEEAISALQELVPIMKGTTSFRYSQ